MCILCGGIATRTKYKLTVENCFVRALIFSADNLIKSLPGNWAVDKHQQKILITQWEILLLSK